MEFIESEKGNQKLNIKLKKNCGGQLSQGGYCPRGAIVRGAIVRGAIVRGAIVLLPNLIYTAKLRRSIISTVVYIFKIIPYSRICSYYHDFLCMSQIITCRMSCIRHLAAASRHLTTVVVVRDLLKYNHFLPFLASTNDLWKSHLSSSNSS